MLTQSAVLDEMTRSNPAFASVTSKTLKDLGWSEHSKRSMISVNMHATYWEAFSIMSKNLISAVPIVSDKGVMIGNLSVKDLRNMIHDPAKFPSLSVPMSEFPSFPIHLITCREKDTLQSVMEKLTQTKVHRLYLIDDHTRPVGVVSLGDILAKFVREPKDSDLSEYFADQVPLAAAEERN
jgi:5'-AMP-activated protein kinase regulatory gamma subunit